MRAVESQRAKRHDRKPIYYSLTTLTRYLLLLLTPPTQRWSKRKRPDFQGEAEKDGEAERQFFCCVMSLEVGDRLGEIALPLKRRIQFPFGLSPTDLPLLKLPRKSTKTLGSCRLLYEKRHLFVSFVCHVCPSYPSWRICARSLV